MLRHIWSILCRRSIIDSETNNITILDVFEQLGVDVSVSNNQSLPKLVNIPIEYEVVSMWFKEGQKEKKVNADAEIEIVNPDGKIEKTFQQSIELPAGMRRLRSRIKISGLVVSMPGDYIFTVKVKEEGKKDYETVVKLPLEVNLVKAIQKTSN